AAYLRDQPCPRTCPTCGETTWRNPLPVPVLLLPIRYDDGGHDGVVVTKRAIEPAYGELCFPGGFLEYGELWPEGAVRELDEETGLVASPDEVTLFDVQSTGRHVLVFGIVPARPATRPPASYPPTQAPQRLALHQPLPI